MSKGNRGDKAPTSWVTQGLWEEAVPPKHPQVLLAMAHSLLPHLLTRTRSWGGSMVWQHTLWAIFPWAIPNPKTGLYGPVDDHSHVHILYHGGADRNNLDVPPKHPDLWGDDGGSSFSTAMHLSTGAPGNESTGPMAHPLAIYTHAMHVHFITGGPLDRGPSCGHPLYCLLKEVLFTLEIISPGEHQWQTRDFWHWDERAGVKQWGHLGCEVLIAELLQS